MCVFSAARTDPLNNPAQSGRCIAVCPHAARIPVSPYLQDKFTLLRRQGSSGGGWRTFCCCDMVKHHLIHRGITHTYMVSGSKRSTTELLLDRAREWLKSKAADSLQRIRGMMSELMGGTSQSEVLIHSLNKHKVAQSKQII